MADAFRPFLDAARQSTNADECNLLCLAPVAWGVSWLSSSGEPKPRDYQLPVIDVPEILPPPEAMHQHLFDRAAGCIGRFGGSAEAWAQRQLGKETFPLTGHSHAFSTSQHALWCPTNACPEGLARADDGHRAPTLFQTALEWASSGRDTRILDADPFIAANRIQHEDGFRSDQSGLRVAQFANRPGLVDRDNYHQFLAEHIRILKQADVQFDRLARPTIESHFLPVRALGQWRAAFDLKVISTDADRARSADRWRAGDVRFAVDFMHPSWEPLFSYALVSAFRQAIDAPNYRRGPLVSDIKSLLPFAVLWWSKEILFVQYGETRARLVRDHHGRFGLDEAPKSRPDRSPGPSFLSRFDPDERWAGGWIVLNLRELGLSSDIYGSWGFDEIHFRAPMLDATLPLEKWESIEQAVGAVFRRALRSRFYSIDAQEYQESFNRLAYLSHGIGNALNAAHNRLHSLCTSLADRDDERFVAHRELMQTKAAVVGRQLAEAQGLAYFARSGLREFDDGPPRDWMLQPKEAPWEREEAIEAMWRILVYFLGAYEPRADADDASLVFLLGATRKDLTLCELAEIARRPTTLTLPPFSRRRINDVRGGAPLFLLTLGLAEILRNARRHLVDSWEEYSTAIPSDAPRLVIDVEIDDRCDVSVLVCGLARPGHNLRSASLDRIIRAEMSLPPRRRLMDSQQARFVPSHEESMLHHPESGFVRTLARWRYRSTVAQVAFSRLQRKT